LGAKRLQPHVVSPTAAAAPVSSSIAMCFYAVVHRSTPDYFCVISLLGLLDRIIQCFLLHFCAKVVIVPFTTSIPSDVMLLPPLVPSCAQGAQMEAENSSPWRLWNDWQHYNPPAPPPPPPHTRNTLSLSNTSSEHIRTQHWRGNAERGPRTHTDTHILTPCSGDVIITAAAAAARGDGLMWREEESIIYRPLGTYCMFDGLLVNLVWWSGFFSFYISRIPYRTYTE